MAKITLKLEEKHIQLIKHFKFGKIDDYIMNIDMWNPYGGDYLMEDLALIFGYWDKHTPGTELDFDGKKYGFDIETEMLGYHTYVADNIGLIINLIFSFIETGLKPGIYSTIDYKLDWKYSELK